MRRAPRRRVLPAATIILLCLVASVRPRTAGAGDDWLPILPQELSMTSEPKAPGAPAIYLYRQVDRDDEASTENNYVRIKVLSEEGRKRGDVQILYFPSQGSIHNIKARTIQPSGTIVNFDGKVYDKTVIKAADFKYSAKTFTLPDVQVGTILEYRYTLEENPYLVFDSHWVLNDELFTKHGKFSVKLSSSYSCRYHGSHLPEGVTLPKASGGSVRLEVFDVPAFQEEELSPPDEEVRAVVEFVYSTNSESDHAKYWKEEGKRMYQTLDNFVGKHGEIAQAAAEIAPAGDPPDVRLKKLYDKVQSLRNLTYEVERTEQEQKRDKDRRVETIVDVWKNGAGSGRDLDWLFLGLVRAAGFQAYDVYIASRDRHLYNPEGTMNSNLLRGEVVVVVDRGVERYFDPGTAFTPFGMLPWYETEINGLRLDKDGGAWVQTPATQSADSRIIRKADLKLGLNGTLSGKLTLTFTGLEALGRRISERNEDDTSRKTYLEQTAQSYIPVGCVVELANKPDWASSSPDLMAEFNIRVPGWASGAGRRALMPLSLFSNGEKNLFEHANRTEPIYFHYRYQTLDDVNIAVPPGWHAATLPPPQNLDRKAFVYGNSVEDKEGDLHLSRKLEVNGIFFQPQNYLAVRAFFQFVKNADEQQIVLEPGHAGSQE